MDFSEKWGTDVEEAVKLALIDLKLERDEVEVTVLEEPSKGFFGIGSKLAKVRVEPKKKEAVPEPEVKAEYKSEPVEMDTKEDKRPEQRKKEKKKRERKKPVIPREPEEELTVVEEHPALEFLRETTEKMGLTLDITAKTGDNSVYVNMKGKDSGTVIGKRGQTLDAIQYLTSLVVNKENEKYIRVVVDAENYRSKREKTLEQLANRLAEKVVRTKKSVRLEPMNPYERKVIHATLQGNPNVTTKSEGEEPYRRVIIELTK
ncbi:protein jag [Ihubacter massiliensis]|uniref:RNA-binding protein KhpB n=1 Tax=Hominibacterium faecale TaxID=2839743 RepID=A0A9J6QUF5_9FIRM|nr:MULTISPECIES: RNA-binding cell elongation regulator Jag/EloR [Eubacteriales Family XIII. Incertae Sedis]MCO7123042.1 protein jag [Ihubacter massiliensis]MCU7377302.1 protein jag [Hominibacterium faecale]